jgi:hypothetical protein
LTAFSDALLSSRPLTPSYQQLRNKTWQQQQQQLQQQQYWQQQEQNLQGVEEKDVEWGSLATSTVAVAAHNSSSSSSKQRQKPQRKPDDSSGNSSSSDSSSLLSSYPRLALLDAAAVVKLASSCVLAGWAPPRLMSLLGMRALQLMSSMDASCLPQLMWAYAACGCRHDPLLFAAAERASELAAAAAFRASRQPLSLLGSLRRLGLTSSEADELLVVEIRRLKAAEQQQQQQQQQRMSAVAAQVCCSCS